MTKGRLAAIVLPIVALIVLLSFTHLYGVGNGAQNAGIVFGGPSHSIGFQWSGGPSSGGAGFFGCWNGSGDCG